MLAWTAAGLAVVIVVASIGAYLKFRSVWDSIKRVSIARLGPQPPKLTSVRCNISSINNSHVAKRVNDRDKVISVET